MLKIITLIKDNWEQFIMIGVLMYLLFMSGTITDTLRGVKKGLKEVFTPLGFIVFLGVAYLAYRIYLNFVSTL